MYPVAQAGLIAASSRDIPPFPVVVPADVDAAVAAMADAEAPVPYAGGTDLFGAVREGKPIGTLIWLRRLDACAAFASRAARSPSARLPCMPKPRPRRRSPQFPASPRPGPPSAACASGSPAQPAAI